MKMSSRILVLVLVALCLCHTAWTQISFSTHWGTGKRSPQLFDTQAQPNAIVGMFAENSKLLECLSKVRVNVMRYMALILEVSICS